MLVFSVDCSRLIGGAVITKDGEMTNERLGRSLGVRLAGNSVAALEAHAMELGAQRPRLGSVINGYKEYLDPDPGVKSVSRRYMTDETTNSGLTPQSARIKLSEAGRQASRKSGPR